MKSIVAARVASRVSLRVLALTAAIALASAPDALARWGGGGGGYGGYHGGGGGYGGFHGGGSDGLDHGRLRRVGRAGGNSILTAPVIAEFPVQIAVTVRQQLELRQNKQSDYNQYNSNQQAQKQSDYNEYNSNQEAQKQAQYNEANQMQESHENTEKHMQYQTDSTINNNVGNTNYNGGGGGGGNNYYYGGSSGGYSGGEVAGAAALGAVGGMAVGSMITASAAQPSTTIVRTDPYGYTPPPYGYAPPPASGPATGGDDGLRAAAGRVLSDGQRTELHVRQRRLLQNLLQRQPGGLHRHQSLRLNRDG